MIDELQAMDGIFKQGFGVIGKVPMRDKRLSAEAKAIYAYICSFAGAGGTAFPSVALICDELGMSENRFYRHKKQLEECGYLECVQQRQGNRLTKNIYKIVGFPRSLSPHFEGTQNEYTQNVGSQNEGTINNSSINNSFKSINSKEIYPSEKKEDSGVKKKPVKHKHGEYQNVLLTDEELDKLKADFPRDWQQRIETLSEYIASKGAKYKSHFVTIKSWARRDSESGASRTNSSYNGYHEKRPEERDYASMANPDGSWNW